VGVVIGRADLPEGGRSCGAVFQFTRTSRCCCNRQAWDAGIDTPTFRLADGVPPFDGQAAPHDARHLVESVLVLVSHPCLGSDRSRRSRPHRSAGRARPVSAELPPRVTPWSFGALTPQLPKFCTESRRSPHRPLGLPLQSH